MRKKTVSHVADTIFWYILYFLPVIGWLIYLFAFGSNPSVVSEGGVSSNATIVGFQSFLSYSGLHVLSNNPLVTTLTSIFGAGGIYPILSPSVINVLGYFVAVYLAHLAVDFLLFIPRLAHKWMNGFTRCE